MADEENAAPDDLQEVDVHALTRFVKQVCLPTLQVDESMFEVSMEKHTKEVQAFISDLNTMAMVVSTETDKDGDPIGVRVFLDVGAAAGRTMSVVFLKLNPAITTSQDISLQVRLLNLPGKGSMSTLYFYLQQAFMPLLQAIAEENKKESKGESKVFTDIEKKMSSLVASLQKAEQSVEVPEITLRVDEEVERRLNANPKTSASDFDDLAKDTAFFTRLEKSVGSWTLQILKVMKLESTETFAASANAEIAFWGEMERGLQHIEREIQQPGVQITLELLKQQRRTTVVRAFEGSQHTALLEKVAAVNKNIMKAFPLADLLSATSIREISAALNAIFEHLKKVPQVQGKYSASRAVHLVDLIGRDVCSQLITVIGSNRLMSSEFSVFEKKYKESVAMFAVWDENAEKFLAIINRAERGALAHMDSKKAEKKQLKELALRARMNDIHAFRSSHHELREVLQSVSHMSAIQDIDRAYEKVAVIDVLDTSPEGESMWQLQNTNYQDMTNRVELQVASSLKDRLAAARNAREMFQVFRKFKALLKRKKVNEAVQEYKNELFSRVESDVQSLQQQFETEFKKSEAFAMCRVRDLPPYSSNAMWARQIRGQLLAFATRIADVMGENWGQGKGRHLRETCVVFYNKLEGLVGTSEEGNALFKQGDEFEDMQALKREPGRIFLQWENTARTVFERTFKVTDRVLRITAKGKGSLDLEVTFPLTLAEMVKETRLFEFMGHRVDRKLRKEVANVALLLGVAMQLHESLSVYHAMRKSIEDDDEMLFAAVVTNVHQCFAKLLNKTWREAVDDGMAGAGAVPEGLAALSRNEPPRKLVQKLYTQVMTLEEKVREYGRKRERMHQALDRVTTGPLVRETFEEPLEEFQSIVTELDVGCYSNVPHWTKRLDEQLRGILLGRLNETVERWHSNLKESMAASGSAKRPRRRSFFVHQDDDQMEELTIPVISLRVRLVKVPGHQGKYDLKSEPDVELARQQLIAHLHGAINVVCGLDRVTRSKMDKISEVDTSGFDLDTRKGTFRLLLQELEPGKIQAIYEDIDKLLVTVKAFVSQWLELGSLWSVDASRVQAYAGEDLSAWCSVLQSIRQQKTTFKGDVTRKSFGVVVVDYGDVQKSLVDKLEKYNKEMQGQFSGLLQKAMGEANEAITKARTEFEYMTLQGSTEEAVLTLQRMRELKTKRDGWRQDLVVMTHGQSLLSKGNFDFPVDWLDVENVQGNLQALEEAIEHKNEQLKDSMQAIQETVMQESTKLDEQINLMAEEWKKQRPLEATAANEALQTLSLFERRANDLRKEFDRLTEAKELLGLPSLQANRIAPVTDEITDLKGVWAELSRASQKLSALGDTPWAMFNPKKVRAGLEEVQDLIKAMKPYIRQYEASKRLERDVKEYISVNVLIGNLKGGAIKERHWHMLMQKLEVTWNLNDLFLRDMWDAQLHKQGHVINDVLRVAQGENALELFMAEVRDTWAVYELELVMFQNKCKVIKGWDALFTKVNEHLGNLEAMKASPFFKPFAEECNSLEDKLNRVKTAFDVWIDVQRRFVYLDGIFNGSAEIKQQLPTEHSRFKSIEKEFLQIMRRVSKNPLVMDVIGIENLQQTLEHIADMLTKVQKALGEFLERQRTMFSRFYFIGDEDLLEIIGGGKDPTSVQRHMSKLFAGISHLVFSEESPPTRALGMGSREGETVMFVQPVDVAADPRIYVWLNKVEAEMRNTLAVLLDRSMVEMASMSVSNKEAFLKWMESYPAQVVLLSLNVLWSQRVDKALKESGDEATKKAMDGVFQTIKDTLDLLADTVLQPLEPTTRKKIEQMLTELVHQRDVTRALIRRGVVAADDFEWLYQMRYYWESQEEDPLKKLNLCVADASFYYGFEYLGIAEKLVQTPLTDRVYLTLCQALWTKMGGCPFGPAGTGKTETVKMLGAQMGRFVLTFNCDENFDFKSMGRIFVGLCQVGAWGCFDEFNRLEERMLSAVSQQILNIQAGIRDQAREIELLDRNVLLNPNVGIFITMNLGYAGRSNLPDNLKLLFRNIACTKPDTTKIANVKLYTQGFRSGEKLAGRVVLLFKLCLDQLSPQPHYDFGLRAMKSVLNSAGNLKRRLMQEQGRSPDDADNERFEMEVLIESVMDTVLPKLVSADVGLLQSLVSDVFPGIEHKQSISPELRKAVLDEAAKMRLTCVDAEGNDTPWLLKLWQTYHIQKLQHGLMMVGPSGCGKTSAWQALLRGMERVEGVKYDTYVIDPKALSKDDLYGVLDSTTMEWTDGIFTSRLRAILNNVRGEKDRQHWIILDGDVDPEWVENLNSVLDDNKLLTLPNGERLIIPPNVHICFEVKDLKYATLATVSRCGMVWFAEESLQTELILRNYIETLKVQVLEDVPEDMAALDGDSSPALRLQKQAAELLQDFFAEGGFVMESLAHALALDHTMAPTRMRMINSMWSLLTFGIRHIFEYNSEHIDFPLADDLVAAYMQRRLVFAVLFGFGGDLSMEDRYTFGDKIGDFAEGLPLPNGNDNLADYEVRVEDGEWHLWSEQVPIVNVDHKKVVDSDVVIPTVDTVRNVEIARSWLADKRPMIFCGPPGSGKTMTLTSTLSSMPEVELVGINFSEGTSPELILKTFAHYCNTKKGRDGYVMKPNLMNKWLVLFCDEINLPKNDNYGTQRVIMFLRQMVEQGGFWRAKDCEWVRIERIQFVGACNPPTDPGRVVLSERFLRHAPVLLVDYPSRTSMVQIYGTFCRALLQTQPPLASFGDELTDSVVDIYVNSKAKFSTEMQAHYIYSPRELSRYTRALYKAMLQHDSMSVEDLVRLTAHEGLRLFYDRLVEDESQAFCEAMIFDVLRKNFSRCDCDAALQKPILFCTWLSKTYESVDQEQLREFVRAKLQVYSEEEQTLRMVVFDDVLAHLLRIDRVLRQPIGHVLQMGTPGWGRNTLSRFVAWLNGMEIFTVKVSHGYSFEDFEEDLRTVMKMAGCQGLEVCFIFNEMKVLGPAMIERMNALLASGEVPGLFDGEEYTALMNELRQRDNMGLDTEEEMYKRFTKTVQQKLHIVFTMNPGGDDDTGSSPALFNRCVVDWYGRRWNEQAMLQAAAELTDMADLTMGAPELPFIEQDGEAAVAQYIQHGQHARVARSMRDLHICAEQRAQHVGKLTHRKIFITPRSYLDFVRHFVKLLEEKKQELEEEQVHLNTGIGKLEETEQEVAKMQEELKTQEAELQVQERNAEKKLQQIMDDKEEANRRKTKANALQEEAEKRQLVVDEENKKAQHELSQVQPMVDEAKQAVKGIKKANLDEIRALLNPPEKVRMAVEMVCLLLGETDLKWANLKKVLRRDDFVKSILDLDANSVSAEVTQKLERDYFSNPDFTYETVNNASKAGGPLVKWGKSLLSYSRVVHSIAPLTNKIKTLKKEAEDLDNELDKLNKEVEDLERKVTELKEDYQKMVGHAETIRNQMQSTKKKVDRSIEVIEHLKSEAVRWRDQSRAFEEDRVCLVGDCLLNGAFLAYGGIFDQVERTVLRKAWGHALQGNEVDYRTHVNFTTFLTHPDNRDLWMQQGLEEDDLNFENVAMVERHNRYPLVIDPSGHVVDFIVKNRAGRNVVKTSFLDKSFVKSLESALRFGNALVVQDVDAIDPIINPLLNGDLVKAGGRVLVHVGPNAVDFSPSFSLVLATRDPSVQFSPELSSRVTFANFTVTPASMQRSCLQKILVSQRPDVENKRAALVKSQGELAVKLRRLERELLDALSKSQGNVLEDDHLLQTMEKIKKESVEIKKARADNTKVMKEVEETLRTYEPLAIAMRHTFFSMEQLSRAHFLYQFSLTAFLRVFDKALAQASDVATRQLGKAARHPDPKHEERMDVVRLELFNNLFLWFSKSLSQEDHVLMGFQFAQICMGLKRVQLQSVVLSFVLSGSASVETPEKNVDVGGFSDNLELNPIQRHDLSVLLSLPDFAQLHNSLTSNTDAWKTMKDSAAPEDAMPEDWLSNEPKEERKLLLQLAVVKVLRPDRVVAMMQRVVMSVMGHDVLINASQLDLKQVIDETPPASPILLAAQTGQDYSGKIDALARTMKVALRSVAMGTAEGADVAEKVIAEGAKKGTWVILKNIHLDSKFLIQLSKSLLSLKPSDKFHLFLTSEISPKLPVPLLHQSRLLVLEKPIGVKNNLLRTLHEIDPSRMNTAPVERSRVYMLLCWLHAVLQERIRYNPVGWTKAFEFGESDRTGTLDMVDRWLQLKCDAGRQHVNPEVIPWQAIRTLIGQSIYGGRVDNHYDQVLLDSFLDRYLHVGSFAADFPLCDTDGSDVAAVVLPDIDTHADAVAFAKSLPDAENPMWLGLPRLAERMLLTQRGDALLNRVLNTKLTLNEEEEEEAEGDMGDAGSEGEGEGAKQAGWWLTLQPTFEHFHGMLPSHMPALEVTERALKDSMFRCFNREATSFTNLLKALNSTMAMLRGIGEQQLSTTAPQRELIDLLCKGIVPKDLRRFTFVDMGMAEWVSDLAKRLQWMTAAVNDCPRFLKTEGVWLGGLMSPEAWITATRQSVAQAKHVSLGDLTLVMQIGNVNKDIDSFTIKGLMIEGAQFSNGALAPALTVSSQVPPSRIRWVTEEEGKAIGMDKMLSVPVYLNSQRKDLVFSALLTAPDNVPASTWFQRGIALILWDKKAEL